MAYVAGSFRHYQNSQELTDVLSLESVRKKYHPLSVTTGVRYSPIQ